jgi:hypothetical protein
MNRRHDFWLPGSLVLLALSGCGGGGGGGGGGGNSTSIAASPTSLTFTATQGDTPPPAAAVVHITFTGAGVVAGYAPGVAEPSWLSVSQSGTATASTVDFALAVTDTANLGTRSTSVRFATGQSDGTQLKYVDVPVTYTIGASDLAVSANPASLQFAANTGGPVPPPQNVALTFNGSSVSLLSVPPPWLTVTPPASSAASPATFGVAVNSTTFAGGSTQSADLVFAASRTGSSLQPTVTVHVDFNVTQPFDATSTAATLAFTSIVKNTQPPQPAAGYAINVVGSQAKWTVTADQPWIKFAPASGMNAGNVTVTTVNSGLGLGTFSGHVTVTDSVSMTSRVFPVTLVNRSANLTVAPTSLSFSVDSTTAAGAASLLQFVIVTDELNGAQPSQAVTWTQLPGTASWLQWTPHSGSSAPEERATAAIVLSELQNLKPGQYTTSVTLLATLAGGATQTVTIPVTLNYQAAYVSFVAPYVGIANQAGSLFVRGVNFASTAAQLGTTLTVTVGSTEISGITPDGDTQLQVSYPALAAGTYPVVVKNAAGIVASNASLVIVNPTAYTYQPISAPSTRHRLVYDAERQVLYATDIGDQEIQSYTLSGGMWTAGTPYVLPQLTDIALSTDGRLLIALTQNSVDDIPLTGGAFIAQPRAANPTAFCGQFLESLAVGNDDYAVVISDLTSCSGFTTSYLYGIGDYSIVQAPFANGYFYDGIAAASADGSKVFIGSSGVSPPQAVVIFNSLDHSYTTSTTANYNLGAVSVSGNASRVILQNTDVYSGALTPTGNIPGTAGVSLASRDSSLAYVYRDDAGGGGPRLDIYNLNGALLAGATFPLLKSVSIADAPNSAAGLYYSISMAETPDGKTVFVSGNSNIVVVPVN